MIKQSIGQARPWEPEEALLLCYAGARMGDAELRDTKEWWEPDPRILPQDLSPAIRQKVYRRPFLLPNGRVVRGAVAAADALGVNIKTLYKRARHVDTKGRRVVAPVEVVR